MVGLVGVAIVLAAFLASQTAPIRGSKANVPVGDVLREESVPYRGSDVDSAASQAVHPRDADNYLNILPDGSLVGNEGVRSDQPIGPRDADNYRNLAGDGRPIIPAVDGAHRQIDPRDADNYRDLTGW